MSIYTSVVKPVGDRVFAVLALIVISPLLALLAWLIHREDGGPVFFRQARYGKDDTTYQIVKFRSMPVGVEELPAAQATNLPVTRVGKFMRRFSLDEIPQLINVARGDMSVVGPRPSMLSLTHLQALRRANGSARLRPGLTGWALVNGFEGMTEDEKATMDGEYVHRIRLCHDLAIILRTARFLTKPPPRV
jgi:O-antigen biosynthesis protein WbqP